MPLSDGDVMEDFTFRLAVARWLGGGLSSTAEVRCHLCAARNPGAECPLLDAEGHHVRTCANGGWVVKRHDKIVKWLRGWLADDRVESDVLVEQLTPVDDEFPQGRLDVTFSDAGQRHWLDVAIPSATSGADAGRPGRARVDGHAAREAERNKRRRYNGQATPFVVELDGRPGAAARALLTRFAKQDGDCGPSADVDQAWRAISTRVQASGAEQEAAAYGVVARRVNGLRMVVP